MKVEKIQAVKDILELIQLDKTTDMEEIEIETKFDNLYIESNNFAILSIMDNLVEYTIVEDYILEGERIIKIKIKL